MREFIVVKNDFPRKAVQLHVESEVVVAHAATRVARDAERRAPVRTGALRASGDSSRGEIVFNIRYAGFVEHGTGKMAAEPFLSPALRAERLRFEVELAAILKGP